MPLPYPSFRYSLNGLKQDSVRSGEYRCERNHLTIFSFLVKLYAIEIASTIIFLAWLARAVWRELGDSAKRASDFRLYFRLYNST